MPRFFVDPFAGDRFVLTGEDARHAARSLRMQPGEELTLCDGEGTDLRGVIDSVEPDRVEGTVLCREKSRGEADIRVVLYQGVPKADKMELIVQKSVELGVSEIVPTVMRRCISRPDEAGARKKTVRWQKIAREAAQQSGRGIIPLVHGPETGGRPGCRGGDDPHLLRGRRRESENPAGGNSARPDSLAVHRTRGRAGRGGPGTSAAGRDANRHPGTADPAHRDGTPRRTDGGDAAQRQSGVKREEP